MTTAVQRVDHHIARGNVHRSRSSQGSVRLSDELRSSSPECNSVDWVISPT
jgi:hypothetical protein